MKWCFTAFSKGIVPLVTHSTGMVVGVPSVVSDGTTTAEEKLGSSNNDGTIADCAGGGGSLGGNAAPPSACAVEAAVTRVKCSAVVRKEGAGGGSGSNITTPENDGDDSCNNSEKPQGKRSESHAFGARATPVEGRGMRGGTEKESSPRELLPSVVADSRDEGTPRSSSSSMGTPLTDLSSPGSQATSGEGTDVVPELKGSKKRSKLSSLVAGFSATTVGGPQQGAGQSPQERGAADDSLGSMNETPRRNAVQGGGGRGDEEERGNVGPPIATMGSFLLTKQTALSTAAPDQEGNEEEDSIRAVCKDEECFSPNSISMSTAESPFFYFYYSCEVVLSTTSEPASMLFGLSPSYQVLSDDVSLHETRDEFDRRVLGTPLLWEEPFSYFVECNNRGSFLWSEEAGLYGVPNTNPLFDSRREATKTSLAPVAFALVNSPIGSEMGRASRVGGGGSSSVVSPTQAVTSTSVSPTKEEMDPNVSNPRREAKLAVEWVERIHEKALLPSHLSSSSGAAVGCIAAVHFVTPSPGEKLSLLGPGPLKAYLQTSRDRNSVPVGARMSNASSSVLGSATGQVLMVPLPGKRVSPPGVMATQSNGGAGSPMTGPSSSILGQPQDTPSSVSEQPFLFPHVVLLHEEDSAKLV